MCGLLFKRSVMPCQNCGAAVCVTAGLFADDHQHRCEHCGSMLYLEMRFGRLKSVTPVSATFESYKGYGGVHVSEQNLDETRVGNAGYDEWKQKDDAWWRNHEP